MRPGHLVGIPAGLFVSALLLGVYENVVRHVFPVPTGFDARVAASWLRYAATLPGGSVGYFGLQWGVACAGGLWMLLTLCPRSRRAIIPVFCVPVAAFAVTTARTMGLPPSVALSAVAGVATSAVAWLGLHILASRRRPAATAPDAGSLVEIP